jgi:hypothetical protein
MRCEASRHPIVNLRSNNCIRSRSVELSDVWRACRTEAGAAENGKEGTICQGLSTEIQWNLLGLETARSQLGLDGSSGRNGSGPVPGSRASDSQVLPRENVWSSTNLIIKLTPS